jgi:hypothetical protein
MTHTTLTWDEAFKPEANDILVELRDDVIEHGPVALANYRQRLGLHTQAGVKLNDLNVNAILTQLAKDAFEHGGVNLPHYRGWLAANTRQQVPGPVEPQATVDAYVVNTEGAQTEEPAPEGMDFTNIGLFGGKLEVAKVWIDYEGPKVFALRSPQFDLYYIVNAVDDDEEEGNWARFLAAPVPADMFHQIDAGQVPLREAFTQAEQLVYEITWKWRQERWFPAVMQMTSEGLPSRWLPVPGASFKSKPLPIPAVLALVPEESAFLADLLAAHIAEAGPLNIAAGAQRALLEKLRGNHS